MITYRAGNQKDISNISKLLIDAWKNSYQDFIPAEVLNSLTLDNQVRRHTKYMAANTTYFVAENEHEELVGFTSYGKNRLKNIGCEIELYTMYVKTDHHRKGIGKSLLALIFSDLENTQNSMVVLVFKKNPFRQFYTQNGFVKIEEEIIDMGTFKLEGEIYMKSE